MNLNISGHHMDLTPALRSFVTNKMQKLERHFDHLIDCNVVLSVEKLRHKAEATLHVSGATLFAESTQEDMYAAIDGMINKLDRQICRYNDKMKDHHPHGTPKGGTAGLHTIVN